MQKCTGQQDNKHRQDTQTNTHTQTYTRAHAKADIFRSTRNADDKPRQYDIHHRKATQKAHIRKDMRKKKTDSV